MTLEQAIHVKEGMVVQIEPQSDVVFGGCMAVVTEVRGWGIVGYVPLVSQQWAYIRLRFEDIEPVGMARWWQDQ